MTYSFPTEYHGFRFMIKGVSRTTPRKDYRLNQTLPDTR